MKIWGNLPTLGLPGDLSEKESVKLPFSGDLPTLGLPHMICQSR